MKSNVRSNTSEAETTDDTETHQVLGGVSGGEEVGTVDLGQVTHGVDKGQGNSADLIGNSGEGNGGVRKSETVGSPETGGHDDKQSISSSVVVDGADDDGADHGNSHPCAEDEATVLGVSIGEESSDGSGNEGNAKNGDSHVLGGSGFVTKTLDESRVEVGESGRTDDGHVTNNQEPGAPVGHGGLEGCEGSQAVLLSGDSSGLALEATDSKGALLLVELEQGSGGGEVGKDEGGDQGETHGGGTFNNEKPSPTSLAVGAIETLGDGTCKETTESTGENGG